MEKNWTDPGIKNVEITVQKLNEHIGICNKQIMCVCVESFVSEEILSSWLPQ